MKYRLDNHIIGKVYDLSQENMNAMIKDIESLKKGSDKLVEALELIASCPEDFALKSDYVMVAKMALK